MYVLCPKFFCKCRREYQYFHGENMETLCEFRGFFLDRKGVMDYNRIDIEWVIIKSRSRVKLRGVYSVFCGFKRGVTLRLIPI